MQITDIIIHINEILNPVQQQSIEDHLRKVEGVIAPRFNDNKPHLLLVSYNPEHVNSSTLLDQMVSKGLTAQLVGL